MKKHLYTLMLIAFGLVPCFANSIDRTVYHDNGEVCEIPLNSNGESFKKSQLKDLSALCELNFYDEGLATCFKNNSTNPGVEVFKVPSGSSKSYLEKGTINCKGAKKLAKFKQSITCSYTPSILAYYHVSQFFDGAGLVPSSVYRTMDRENHKSIVLKAISNNSRIKNFWKRFLKVHKEYVTRKEIFLDATNDFQLYGALSENPRGEGKYYEIWGYKVNGKTYPYGERYKGFRASSRSGYKFMNDSRPLVNQAISKKFKYAAHWIQRINDISQMIVIDYIMSQADRFVNQHYYEYHVARLIDGSIKKFKAKKYAIDANKKVLIKNKTGEQTSYREIATNVKYLLLKDNDCGVIKANKMKSTGLLDNVKHLSPSFYKKLLEWNTFIHSSHGATHMRSVAKLTDSDIKKMRRLTKEATEKLQSHCQSKSLKLDVDLDDFLAGEYHFNASDCL